MAGPFQSAPVEVVDYILILADPETVSSVSQTSRTLHIYIRDNGFLWKSIFEKYFDLPEEHNQSTDWRSKVQYRTRVKHTILAPSSVRVSYTKLQNVSKALVQIIRSAPPGRGRSKNIAWVDGILKNPAIWPPHSPITFTHPQLSQHSQPHSELQVLECDRIGRPEDRIKARTYVYDMRNYHDATLRYSNCTLRPDDSNLYGPFIVRGSLNEPFQTNYFHLRYIMNVLLNNLRDSPSDNAHAWIEGGFENTRPMTAPPSPVDGDWAGVQGNWLRITSWLSYNDFKEYNQPGGKRLALGDVPNSDLFRDPLFTEVTAFSRITMRITSIDPPSTRHPMMKPKIHFEGTSSGGGLPEAKIEGTVRDHGGDVFRWRTSDIVGGNIEWHVNGVQIGGVQSAAGWAGCWTKPGRGRDHDPVGPSWMYKVKGISHDGRIEVA